MKKKKKKRGNKKRKAYLQGDGETKKTSSSGNAGCESGGAGSSVGGVGLVGASASGRSCARSTGSAGEVIADFTGDAGGGAADCALGRGR